MYILLLLAAFNGYGFTTLLDTLFITFMYNYMYIGHLKRVFPHQSPKRFTFHVKLSDSIFLLLGFSPIVI